MDKLYNKLNDLGFTPTGKTPDDIVNAISKLYTDRYNSGYGAGRTQGQNDVKANPGAYGIIVGTLKKIRLHINHLWGSHEANHYMDININYGSNGGVNSVTGSASYSEDGRFTINVSNWS